MTPIDLPAASLLAQVIPTLLVFIALEGRLKRPASEPSMFRVAHLMFRAIALFWGIAATNICLWVVILARVPDGELGGFLSLVIAFGAGVVSLEAIFVIAKFLSKEVDDHM